MSDQDRQYENLISVQIRNLLCADYIRCELSPAFIEATSRLQITRLDYWERVFRHEMWQSKQTWNPVRKLLLHRNRKVRLAWIDCCNGNGYLREDALRAIETGAPNSFLLALVLRRLNDWVPEVRAVACECIPQIVKGTRTEYTLEALWSLLPHLYTWGRIQPEGKQVVVDILGFADIPLRLSERIIAATAGPAPAVLRQVGRQSAFDSFLSNISTEAVQPAVRAKAYQSQLDKCVTWVESYQWVWTDKRWCKGRYKSVLGRREIQVSRPYIELLKTAAIDKSPIVRRVAGNALFTKPDGLGVDVMPIAQMLAKDPCPSVSERGEFALKHLSTD